MFPKKEDITNPKQSKFLKISLQRITLESKIFKRNSPGVPVVQFQKTWYPRFCLTDIYHIRVELQKSKKLGAPELNSKNNPIIQEIKWKLHNIIIILTLNPLNRQRYRAASLVLLLS
jgi:hypothetical protein